MQRQKAYAGGYGIQAAAEACVNCIRTGAITRRA